MTDLSKTIAPKSDQLNADDLIGGPLTLTITRVSADPSSAEQPVSISFEGDGGKPYKPCKSMRRVMVHLWGKDGAAYAGRSMTIYRDAEVQFGGMKVGGIRISHMSHISKAETMALTATRANRKPFTVRPLEAARQSNEAKTVDPAPMLAAARNAAKLGTKAFGAWWNSDDGKAARDVARPIMDELKSICAAADEAIAADPFGLPPVDHDTPSADELARAEQEAMQAIRDQNDKAA